jgi:hypothetical protein
MDRAGDVVKQALGSPAYVLWARIACLRYLRADLHVAAWSARGLTALKADCLTRLWRAREGRMAQAQLETGRKTGEAIQSMSDRGLLARGHEELVFTPAGRSLRTAIEDETNDGNGAMFEGLESTERADLVEALRELLQRGDTESTVERRPER